MEGHDTDSLNPELTACCTLDYLERIIKLHKDTTIYICDRSDANKFLIIRNLSKPIQQRQLSSLAYCRSSKIVHKLNTQS
jgi:hypothetical protein